MQAAILELTERGLYCPIADVFIDPWSPVDRAVITHAHADHAVRGSAHYLCARTGEGVLRLRMGPEALIDSVGYGEAIERNGVRISLHPAGHILGSAQVRLEYRGEVAVVSGDYKLEADATCTPFEAVRCHLFVTESTFGLPIYRWPPQALVFEQLNSWWRASADAGKACLLFAYSLGKAQRLLAGLDSTIGPIYTHGAVEPMNRAYRQAGVELPPTEYAMEAGRTGRKAWAGAMVIAPPSAQGTPWARRFGAATTGFASGWMRIRGTRRRRALDRGFVLSDHVDWPGLQQAIAATGAERVWVTHGYSSVVVRWLKEKGLDAQALATRFEGETGAEGAGEVEEPARESEG